MLREGESLRVAAPEPFTPDSASSMEQVQPPKQATHSWPRLLLANAGGASVPDCTPCLELVQLPVFNLSPFPESEQCARGVRSRGSAALSLARIQATQVYC